MFVAERFHVSQSTIFPIKRRMLTTGSLKKHFRSGRPMAGTWRQDREKCLLYFRNRFQSAVEAAAYF
jgi:transposase